MADSAVVGLDLDVDAVSRVITEVSRTVVEPRFGSLRSGEIEEKAPNEVVTVVDRECEQVLTEALVAIVDAPVVGEEAAGADPDLLALVAGTGPLWLVDPLDGTANFAAGLPEYAIMVALLDGGRPVASWILQPEPGRLAVAVRGRGATIDGRPVRVPPPPADPAAWLGVVKDRFLPDDVARSVDAAGRELGPRRAVPHCAGHEYPALLAGHHHYLLYWRTLPWDHLPGALLAEEAGCRCLRPDGEPYRAGDHRGEGLLVAPAPIADELVERLFG